MPFVMPVANSAEVYPTRRQSRLHLPKTPMITELATDRL